MTIPRLVLPLGLAVAVMVPLVTSAQSAAPPAPRPAAPPQEASRRVVVTAAVAPAYACAAVTCRVVTELDKGAIVSVVKTDGEWSQVLVRTSANAMTTGWLKTTQVSPTGGTATRTGDDRTDGVFRPEPAADAATSVADVEPDPRGCLTCLATRQPSPEEWEAAIADAATRKATLESSRVTPGLADGRTSEERMRDVFAERYDPEVQRLSVVARSVDTDLQGYLSSCFQRFASIPVEGAAPRSNAVDDVLRAARSSPGAARFALWSGTAAFQWNPSWAPQTDDRSALPSCERQWEDVRGRADRLRVDLDLLERDARAHDIFPGVVREMLAARGLAEQTGSPSPPVRDIR